MNIAGKYLIIFVVLNFISSMKLHSQETNSEEGNNSQFVNQSIPLEMDTGKKYNVWINMKNIGATTWFSSGSSKSKQYKLSFVKNGAKDINDLTAGSSILLSQNVTPGQSPIINFTITAPSKAGDYISQWRMMQGDDFFGEQTKSVIIKVVENVNGVTASNNAVFVKQTVPKLMKAKFKSAVSITVENNGNTKWLPENFSLALVDEKMQPSGKNPWGITSVKLPAAVEPGTKVTFKFQIRVPDETGSYNMQFGMMKDELSLEVLPI